MSSRRMLRDITDSEKVNKLKDSAEVLFYRLMMKADDYGSFHANPKLIKAACYPLRDTVRDSDISRWTDELRKAGLIVVYADAGKTYLRILNFGQRLRNKRNLFPPCPPELLESCGELPQVAASGGEWRPEEELEDEYEVEEEKEVENSKAKALPGGKPPLPKFDGEEKALKEEFKALQFGDNAREAWVVIKDWIIEKKPQFIDPYYTAWNIFASFYGLPSMREITNRRRKKFGVRIKESGFDFIEILAKARASDFLKSSTWFCFDWLIDNDSNYLKVLEGNYK